MDKKKTILVVNLFLSAVMILFILHYYHFYYHRPMMDYFARMNSIRECHEFMKSNFTEEEIKRMSLYQMFDTNHDILYPFLLLERETPNDLDEITKDPEVFDQYIGYSLFKNGDGEWMLMEKASSYHVYYKRLLAINNDGEILEMIRPKLNKLKHD